MRAKLRASACSEPLHVGGTTVMPQLGDLLVAGDCLCIQQSGQLGRREQTLLTWSPDLHRENYAKEKIKI